MRLSGFVVILLVSMIFPATPLCGGSTPSGDLAKLQGRWAAKAGPKRDIAVMLEVEGSEARVKVATPQGLTFNVSGTIKIDESAKPHALDWSNFHGLDDQELPEIPAIYELQGDKFKVCNGGPNNQRPKEFKAGDGVLAEVVVFERIK